MAGRPKSSFSDEEVAKIEQYARIGSYNKTIAVGLGIAENTLKRHFGAKIRHWRAAGKLDMRESLHKQRDTSPQTAIFIAKNELGMTDKVEKTDGLDKTVVALTPVEQKLYAKIAEAVMAEERKETEVAQRANIKLHKPSEGVIEEKTA